MEKCLTFFEYFEDMTYKCIVGNWRMPVLAELYERAISIEEVRKDPGLDVFTVGRLNKPGETVFEWLVRLLNESFHIG